MKTLCSLLLISSIELANAATTKLTIEPWPPEARITVKAVDENRAPISGAEVWFQFYEKESTGRLNVRGTTDSEGFFSGQGYSQDTKIGANVTKNGYYRSSAPVPEFLQSRDGKLQPWNPTVETMLRKIEKPVAMYAKNVFLKVPQIGKPCGFDLKECDWVSPWGKGLVPDFVFTLNCAYTNFNHQDVSMRLTFSNPLDGIQPANLPKEYAYSEFIWHRQAPEAGYTDNYQMEFGLPDKGFKIPGVSKIRSVEEVEALKYYFRVRTVVKDRQIVSALYGKLSQGFFIGAMSSTDVNVRTCYYLNPKPLDRNMEFDLMQNLFKNLTRMEQPRRPLESRASAEFEPSLRLAQPHQQILALHRFADLHEDLFHQSIARRVDVWRGRKSPPPGNRPSIPATICASGLCDF